MSADPAMICSQCGKGSASGMVRCSACGALLGDSADDETCALEAEIPRPVPVVAAETWGSFRLLERVGQGSFGEVYRAFDTTLEREVALKLLLPRYASEDDDTKAILREARLIARIRHTNVVPVYGVDRFNGRVGFWSDFVRGRTLSSLLAAQGRFGAMETTLIGIDICKAVNAVHSAGLLHRDIKASNVMREEGGRILLMDFGLSLEHKESHSLGGTPSYMAPELFRGRAASVASDIYALGVLMYELLTGKLPIPASNLREMKTAHQTGARRSLYDERSDLPDPLVRAVERALDPDPAKRFQTAGQMISALSESMGVASPSMSVDVLEPEPAKPVLRPWMLLPAIAIVGLLAWFAFAGPRPQRQSPIGNVSAHTDYLKAQDYLDHYYKPGNMDRAIELFHATITRDPRFALAYAGLCRAWYLQYRDRQNPALIESAQDACGKAIALESDLASAHVTLGMLYTRTSRNDLAAQEIQSALALDSRSAEAYAALAELYDRQGRAKDVEPNFRKAVDLAPSDWQWPNQLGRFYLANGRFADAERAFREGARLTPDNPREWNNLGIVYRRQSKFAEAKTAFHKAIDLEPADNYLSNLGNLLVQEGSYTEAAQLYQKSAAINPSNYLAYANLASVYNRMPGQQEKVREMYLKAIEVAERLRSQSPKDPTLLSSLGSYYATVHMEEKSLPLLRQAAALDPDDPQVLYRVAEGYELLHHRAEALSWIGKALEHKFPLEVLRRNPEMAGLISDPHFVNISRDAH
jgi:tetratricopeptide (TPR) repeat protein